MPFVAPRESGCVQVFGRRPAERAECLVIAGVQKPAHKQTCAFKAGAARVGVMQPEGHFYA